VQRVGVETLVLAEEADLAEDNVVNIA